MQSTGPGDCHGQVVVVGDIEREDGEETVGVCLLLPESVFKAELSFLSGGQSLGLKCGTS